MSLLISAIGVLLGGCTAALWLCLARWFTDTAFWTSVRELTSSLLVSLHGDEFIRKYLTLLRHLGVYLAKTTCRMAITVLPVVFALHLLSPWIARTQFRRATSLVVYPTQAVKLSTTTRVLAAIGGEFPWPTQDAGGAVTVATGDWTHSLPYTEPVVVTNSTATGAAYQACGFRVCQDPGAPDFLLLRPSAHDANPLWPYLNDLEFTFWTSMILASLVAGCAIRGWSRCSSPSLREGREERAGRARISES